MLWKFPHNAHLINLDHVEVLTPISTVVTPAEGNFAETRRCFFTVRIAGTPIEIAVVDYDETGMLTAEQWNQKLDELEADYDALVWQFLGTTPAPIPAEQDDTIEGSLKDEVIMLNAMDITRWHHVENADGTTELSISAQLPAHPQTDELIAKLREYAMHVRMPDIPLDDTPLGSAAL